MFINFIYSFPLDQATEYKTKNYLLEFSTYLASQMTKPSGLKESIRKIYLLQYTQK